MNFQYGFGRWDIFMGIAITRTKIHVPRRRSDLLSRPRLNSALADLLDYPFTLISAPAGYGKTCLMIDLADQTALPACWFSIDPLDKDPKRFLAHFIQAIKLVFPDFGKTSLDLLDNLTEPLNPPSQFISTLVNDIYMSVSENFLIFLDDFHLLDNQQQISGFISNFGQHMDENTHLVISSRKLFNFPNLSLLIGRKLVKGVNQNDLAFRPQELQQYFHEKLQQPLSEKESKIMISNTAGWITGLLLSKANRNSALPGQNKASKVTGADLDSYFTDQVFKNQPSSIRNLMLRTSLFDEFNTNLCRTVIGEQEDVSWSEFQALLTTHNLFVEQVEDGGLWIRYHHLFRDFLRHELENHFPKERHIILNRLVNVHMDSQEWEKAFAASQQLGEPLKMAEVINHSFSPLFHAGRIKLLADWLEILPEEAYLEYPKLLLYKGISYTSIGNPVDGLNILTNALNNQNIRDDQSMFSRGLLCRATTHRFLGNYPEALANLEEILRNPQETIIETGTVAEAQREAALCNNHMGNFAHAEDLFLSSLASYKILGDINNSALVHSDLGYALMSRGHLSKAKIHFIRAQRIWEQLDNYSQLSILLNNLATLSILSGEYYKSIELLDKAESYSIKTHNNRIHSFVIGSKGDLAFSLSEFRLAHNYYEEAEEIAKSVKEFFLLSYLQIAKATCLRCLGDTNRAKEILTGLKKTLIQGNSKNELGLWYLEWGYTHLKDKMPEIAREAFHEAHNIFAELSKPYDQAKSLLGLCLLGNENRKNTPLIIDLYALEKTIGRVETMMPLVPEFSCHREEIERITSHVSDLECLPIILNKIDHYRKRLPDIRKRIFHPPVPFVETSRLEIRAFGEIEVCQSGNRISASEWIHQKTVREIFFYLLSQPRGVTKEQVGLTFWPESSPNQLNCQFKNAIYRLRRAIGKDTIQYNQNTRSYSFNWDCQYSYDVEDFQEVCRLAYIQQSEVQRAKLLQRAVSIYKHPYAPQLESSWAEPLRRILYLDYEKAQLKIAAYNMKIKNYSACLDTCMALLEIEPCQEKAYQLCMKSYASIGDKLNVIRIFDECQYNMKNILNIEPSIDTKSLFERVINS